MEALLSELRFKNIIRTSETRMIEKISKFLFLIPTQYLCCCCHHHHHQVHHHVLQIQRVDYMEIKQMV